jgi:uncharacterized protein (DUF58 family)
METGEVLRRVRRLEIRARHLVEDVFAGQSESVFKGRGVEFAEVRPYVVGDEVRDIDWNVTARFGSPYVKRFVEERELTVVLLVDASGSLEFGSQSHSKRELAAELASLLAFAGLKNSARVGLVLFSDRLELFVPPRRGRSQVLRVVRELLTRPLSGTGTDWAAGLEFANRVLRRHAVLFVLSDFLAPVDQRLFRITARRHELVCLWIEDPREQELPAVGWVMFEDLESGRLRAIDTRDRRARAAFRAARAEARERARLALRRVGADHIELSTAHSYLPPLLRYFAERRRRLR